MLGMASVSRGQSLVQRDFNAGAFGEEASSESVLPSGADDDSYQIGEEWGKHPYEEDLAASSPVYKRATAATARVGGATGFYIGRFAGHHILGTNHHVCPSSRSCSFGGIKLPTLGISTRAVDFVGTWQSIDLSLLVIRIKPEEEALLAEIAANFAFDSPIYPGQEIITSGFGRANNRRREMVVNQDRDCVVFSQRNDFRLLADPDEFNTGGYKAWSFANGCDVSHGDSGSAMVDRVTGELIGVIWTGRIPKDPAVRDSDFLAQLLGSQNQKLWTELSYAVPAAKIKEVLTEHLKGNVDSKNRRILEAILENRIEL